LLVTVNYRLKFEIKIVHELSCHPMICGDKVDDCCYVCNNTDLT